MGLAHSTVIVLGAAKPKWPRTCSREGKMRSALFSCIRSTRYCQYSTDAGEFHISMWRSIAGPIHAAASSKRALNWFGSNVVASRSQ